MTDTKTVFLHPVSARIIGKDYGFPVMISHRDHLHDHLVISLRRHASPACRIPVLIGMQKGALPDISPAIGDYLWRIHKRHIFTFILSHVLAGKSALSAINTFYEIYDIDDDDFDRDNMYREWTRYYYQYKKTAATTVTLPASSQSRPLTHPDDIVAAVVAMHIDVFYMHRSQKLNAILIRKLYAYIYYEHMRMTTYEIAEKYKVSLRLIQYYLRSVRELLHQYPAIAHTLTQLTQPS
jgi:hypothetical protein